MSPLIKMNIETQKFQINKQTKTQNKQLRKRRRN